MGNDVYLALTGHFTAEEAEEATARFIVLVGEDTVRFIVDLGQLNSYDKDARIRWQKILAPMKQQISIIIFVGDAPPLVRMAASTVALAVGIRMKFVSTIEEAR